MKQILFTAQTYSSSFMEKSKGKQEFTNVSPFASFITFSYTEYICESTVIDCENISLDILMDIHILRPPNFKEWFFEYFLPVCICMDVHLASV
jgi:hypothetical protein